MFSRKERDYLLVLAGTRGPWNGISRGFPDGFPSAAYQRKLLWGIRKKAAAAMVDLELYAEAAEVESKVLPITFPRAGDPVPLAADPLVTLLRRVQVLVARAVRSSGAGQGPLPNTMRSGREQ